MKSKKRKLKNPVRLKSLDHNHNTRVRWESLDADYLKKLSQKDLEWYAQFIDEYVGGAISKNKDGTPKKGHIHNTPELAKKCYDANNRRNSDLYSVKKATRNIQNLDILLGDEKDGWYITNPELTEAYVHNDIEQNRNPEELTFKEYIKVRKHMNEDVRTHLDEQFLAEHPRAYMFYYVYDNTRITDGKLDRLLAKPELLEKFVENFELFKRKKNRTNRR